VSLTPHGIIYKHKRSHWSTIQSIYKRFYK
jgi:hypothetical protein